MTGPAKINHVSAKNCLLFILTIHANRTSFISNAEFNGHVSAIYRNKLPQSQ